MNSRSPVTDPDSGRAAPGRHCPLHYRYTSSDLARSPDIRAGVLYVVGGLYGNTLALATILELAAKESAPVTLAFNGDFNWFNVDDAAFRTINEAVLKNYAIRGNVETEIAGGDETAGCGCSYPDWVSDAEVARSNEIIARLRTTARRFPGLRRRLAALPMHLVAEVAGVRAAIVHGDADSLAGWSFSQEMLAAPGAPARLAANFEQANVQVFASTHTCLPVAIDCGSRLGRCILINNGAAGMPNFEGTTGGLITRIAARPAPAGIEPLYATRLGTLRVEALPVHYDALQWQEQFRTNWPPGSAAHESYYRRITQGPRYTLSQAVRWHVSPQ